MKKFECLFFSAVSIVLLALLLCIMPSAATTKADEARKLKPGSNKVMFISDEVLEKGYSKPGKGLSADDPFKPITHPNFNGGDTTKKNHLNTAFYQALEKLVASGGGTLVICGPCTFGNAQSYGVGDTTKDVFTPKIRTNTIKFTSVYNGVDYRKTNGARIIIKEAAMFGIEGQSIWENITFETSSSNRCISFSNYTTLVGEGIECYTTDESDKYNPEMYLSLSGGYRYSKSDGAGTNLVVQSGTYNKLVAGMWGTVQDYSESNAKVNLTIEGTAKVLGEITGTPRHSSPFSGEVSITINGGIFNGCEINCAGITAFQNKDGKVTLKVNGGDFTGLSCCSDVAGVFINPPKTSVLDCSDFQGDEKSLAYLIGVADDFTEGIKLPKEKDLAALKDVYNQIMEQEEKEEKSIVAEEIKSSGMTLNDWTLTAFLMLAAEIVFLSVFVIVKKKQQA